MFNFVVLLYVCIGHWNISKSFTKDSGPLLDTILVMINLFMMSIPIALASHVAAAPRYPMYFSSLIPEDRHVILALLSFGYWIMIAQSSILFSLHIQAIFTPVFYSTPIMSKDLRAGMKEYRTKFDLRSRDNLPHEYRCFELMHYYEMDYYGKLILPLHILVYVLIMFPSATLIQYASHMHGKSILLICLYIIEFVTWWGTLLQFGGYYLGQNVKTIKSWRRLGWNTEDKKYMSRFSKSCRPLQLGDQSRFKINKLSILFFARGLSRGIVRILLTTVE